LDALGLDELPDVVHAGLPLGRLVDIPAKWFLMRGDLDGEPLAAPTLRRFLRAGRPVVDRTAALLDELRPDVVLLLNGLFFFEAIAWALCRDRGIDVVTYERGLIKETLVFRRNQAACLLDVGESWNGWEKVPLTADEDARLSQYLAERQQGLRTIDRFWGGARFVDPERHTGGRLVSLFANLTWDSAVIGQELAFSGIADWVEAAIAAFAERPDHELIVRVHPAEVKLPGKQTREPLETVIAERFPDLPPNVRVIGPWDATSSYPIMAASDAVLVFSSTTGLEAALAGKPVIVAGRTHYRDKGFTVDVTTPEQFVQALDDVLDDPARFAPDTERVRRYGYLFFFRVPVRSPGVEEHVLGLARLTTDRLDDLRPEVDADLDRLCDGILSGGEFAPAPP